MSSTDRFECESEGIVQEKQIFSRLLVSVKPMHGMYHTNFADVALMGRMYLVYGYHTVPPELTKVL